MQSPKFLPVNGIQLEVIEGCVSFKKLNSVLGLDHHRQREKAMQVFSLQKIKFPSYNGLYTQLAITLQDAQVFISTNGLWKRGRYKPKIR